MWNPFHSVLHIGDIFHQSLGTLGPLVPLLGSEQACDSFVITLERLRRWYGFYVTGFVVMPDHVHLLLSEPERSNLAVALQMLKQIVSQELNKDATNPSGSPATMTSMFTVKETDGKTGLHAPERSTARIGHASRVLDVEQRPALCHRSRMRGGD